MVLEAAWWTHARQVARRIRTWNPCSRASFVAVGFNVFFGFLRELKFDHAAYCMPVAKTSSPGFEKASCKLVL